LDFSLFVVRVIPQKNIAFVRYKYRSQAEFAKEAMHCQSMEDNELLEIRWATEGVCLCLGHLFILDQEF
jgi:hypothetical protein